MSTVESTSNSVQLVKRGLWSTWEAVQCTSSLNQEIENSRIIIPPISLDPEPDNSKKNTLCPHDVSIRACSNVNILISRRVKAVRMENCEKVVVEIPYGVIATVELLRCKNVEIQLGGPISCARIDESISCSVVLTNKEAICGFGGDADGSGMSGVNIFSTGSHKIRIIYTRHNGQIIEHLIPETIHTVIHPPQKNNEKNTTGTAAITEEKVKEIEEKEEIIHTIVKSTSPWAAPISHRK